MSTIAGESLQMDEEEEFKKFVISYRNALQGSGIPETYWRSFHHKLTNEVKIYDAGEVFAIIQIQENYDDGGKTGECMDKDKPGTMHSKVVVSCQSGLQASQPTSIFLVDHAWTYRVDHARQQLQQIPGLLSRMASVMGLDLSEKKNDADGVELVMENMWLYNQTFQRTPIDCAEEKIPVWYIMDEFGSQVRHSDQPSCGLAPLFFAEAQAAFTVLWPLRDLQKGDEVTRDFAYGESDPLVRQCRVCPKITEPADSYYEAVLRESKEQLPVEIHSLVPPKGRILKVYSEMSQVINHLTHAGFELTVNEEEADIIWSYNHIKDYRKFSTEQPHVMLNQFPCENLITVKDCLAALARRVTSASDMIPNTLNLHTELPQFIKHDQEGQDIHCICKPWNLARGMDNTHQQQPDLQRQRENTPNQNQNHLYWSSILNVWRWNQSECALNLIAWQMLLPQVRT
uniref:Tubulin tyrosine ligase-like family, member 12 n=1 Tax=Hippocampus comes TaxID=109280 RepID=A0A3Q2Z8G9_HIPCM